MSCTLNSDRECLKVVDTFRNALLLLLSLCVSVAVAEVLIRLFVPVGHVGPIITVKDPVMGKRIKKSFHTVRVHPDFTMTFTSNSLGFRGPEPDSPLTDSVLFIGDSFTMGYGVSDGEEFPALIKAMFDTTFGKNAISVVNTGMGDNGNGRWIKLLRDEAAQFKPRLIVLQVLDNDYEDNVRETLFRVSDSGALVELPINPAKDLGSFLDDIPGLSSSYLYRLIRQTIAFHSSGAVTRETAGQKSAVKSGVGYAERLTERLISEALAICRRKGYPVFAILVGLKGERLSRVQGIFQADRIAVFQVPDKTERPDLYFKIDGHWNQAGHAFVACAVFDQLQSLKLIQKR